MLRLLADEHINPRIVDAACKLNPGLDFITVNDAKLRSAPDADILEWAAVRDYVVVSHDYATMGPEARARVIGGLPMPGVILLPEGIDIGVAARHLYTLASAGRERDLADQVIYIQWWLPLPLSPIPHPN